MKGNGTVARYRMIDLSLWALILLFFESVVILASVRWFPGEPYTVSVTGLVVAVVLMRWGPWAGIHAVLGGLTLCLLSGADGRQWAVYGLGNLFALLSLFYLRAEGAEKVRASTGRSLVFALAVQVAMQAGRAAVSIVLGAPLSAAAGFFTTDIVSVLFTLTAVWIVRRLDGVFEEQHHYLARVRREQDREEGGTR